MQYACHGFHEEANIFLQYHMILHACEFCLQRNAVFLRVHFLAYFPLRHAIRVNKYFEINLSFKFLYFAWSAGFLFSVSSKIYINAFFRWKSCQEC